MVLLVRQVHKLLRSQQLDPVHACLAQHKMLPYKPSTLHVYHYVVQQYWHHAL